MSRFLAAALLVLASPPPSSGAADCSIGPVSQAKADAVRAYLEDVYPHGSQPGAAVLAACGGDVLFAYQGGMANIEWQQPITGDTSFRLGSISKPLTAVAVLQLVESGELDLDEPIGDLMPLLPAYMRPVTVRQLMSHTSGLPDILLTPSLLPLARDWVSKDQVIGMQAHTPPRSVPGETFEYSNFNYVLLASLIEAVTDTPYAQYMNETVFEVLEMDHSHYDSRRAILRERAQGYETDAFGRLLNSENIDMSHASAAGALMSSAHDLARWSNLLTSGQLLEPATLETAWSPQLLPGGELSAYGLGFNVGRENGRRVIWHSGLASGFKAGWSVYPDLGLTVIVLSNGFHLPNTTTAMDVVASMILAEP